MGIEVRHKAADLSAAPNKETFSMNYEQLISGQLLKKMSVLCHHLLDIYLTVPNLHNFISNIKRYLEKRPGPKSTLNVLFHR